MKNKFWFIEFPTYQYKENVMELAHVNHLEIVDIKFKSSMNPDLAVSEKDALKLTKIK
jgi:hypothetical protein